MYKINLSTLHKLIKERYLTTQKNLVADLNIFNYSQKAEYTIMARGFITDNEINIIAISFEKIFNLEEDKDNITLKIVNITEKIHGSLGILYFANDKPFIATR